MKKTFFYNGMTYEYDHDTRFIVQTGRYTNTYITRSVRTGEYEESIESYEALVIDNGYKKRLIMIDKDGNKKVIARYISERNNVNQSV